MSLEQELVDLGRLAKIWQSTLDAAKQTNAPVEPLQNAVDSIEQRRQAVEASRARVLTLLSQISDEETRIRRTLSSIEQSQVQALRDLLVRDSPPIWRLKARIRTGVAESEHTVVCFSSESCDGVRQATSFFLCHSCRASGGDRSASSKSASRRAKVGKREARARAGPADP